MTGYIDYDLPAEIYHARSELSSSTVASLATKPPAKHFADRLARAKADRDRAEKAVKAPASALEFGTISHSVVLEPDSLERLYMVAVRPDQRSNAGKQEWIELHAMARSIGKTLVSQQDMDSARCIRDSVLALPSVAQILNGGGKPEVSVFAGDEEHGIGLRSREDMMPTGEFTSDIILDLKTARDATPQWFGADAVRHGYDIRAYHYRRCRQLAVGGDPSFVWVVVESDWPHLACDYWVEPSMWAMFQARWLKGVTAWRECMTSGQWPMRGPDDSYIQLPAWYSRQNAVADEGGWL